MSGVDGQTERMETVTAPIEQAAWILAGGLGTRLRGAVPDRPKVLAPIAGTPFLTILLECLARAGFRRVRLLLGVRHAQVTEFLRQRRASAAGDGNLEIAESIEPAPCGTGGALKQAESACDGPFFVFNGDTFLEIDPHALLRAHRQRRAILTIAATSVRDAAAYNRIDVGDDGLVRAFRQKGGAALGGMVNAGVYVVEPGLLRQIPAHRPVSLEQEVFPALLAGGQRIAAVPVGGPFFDIGTPTGYQSFNAYWAACGRGRVQP